MTKVEFNCLKLVLSIDSWVAVLDFFGVAGDEPDRPEPTVDAHHQSELCLLMLYIIFISFTFVQKLDTIAVNFSSNIRIDIL